MVRHGPHKSTHIRGRLQAQAAIARAICRNRHCRAVPQSAIERPMHRVKHILHSRTLGTGEFGALEIHYRPVSIEQMVAMRLTGRFAQRNLRALFLDQANMRILRSLVVETRGFGVHRRSDDDMLAWFARQIATHRLHLAPPTTERRTHRSLSQASLSQATGARPIDTPMARPARRRAPTPEPPPPQPAPPPPRPPPTFGHVNQDLQAAVLEAAARDGTPFCEECQGQAS